MIRQVKGKVLEANPLGAVIEVAGLGVFVFTPADLTVGEDACLSTYLAVKQDGMELYGFSDAADRDFFELLLSVSGVGPKTALSILRRAPRESLQSAIARRDITYLTRVAGLGKKSAEKMAIELAEKLAHKKEAGQGEDTEVFDTLVALGYTEREARKALSAIAESVVGKEARLRAALSSGR
jgi:Holliday junction DNA helicase RuvA